MDKVIQINYKFKTSTWELVKRTIADEQLCDYFILAVSNYSHIPVQVMTSKKRDREIIRARYLAIYIMRKFTKASLKAIGQKFGKRDHTTIIHAMQEVKNQLDTYDEYAYRFITEFEAYISKFYAVQNPNPFSRNY